MADREADWRKKKKVEMKMAGTLTHSRFFDTLFHFFSTEMNRVMHCMPLMHQHAFDPIDSS